MRAKFVAADGAWRYVEIASLLPEIRFPLSAYARASVSCSTDNAHVQIRCRRYEYFGPNDNNVPVYLEILE